VPLLQDMARVMQSIESPNGLTHSNIGSHIFRTLDDGQMGLILIDMVMVAQDGQKSHTLGSTPQRLSCIGWRTLHREMIGGNSEDDT
jgi:hypothetical protein